MRCKRCKKVITDEKSMQRGYGPRCWKLKQKTGLWTFEKISTEKNDIQ